MAEQSWWTVERRTEALILRSKSSEEFGGLFVVGFSILCFIIWNALFGQFDFITSLLGNLVCLVMFATGALAALPRRVTTMFSLPEQHVTYSYDFAFGTYCRICKFEFREIASIGMEKWFNEGFVGYTPKIRLKNGKAYELSMTQGDVVVLSNYLNLICSLTNAKREDQV